MTTVASPTQPLTNTLPFAALMRELRPQSALRDAISAATRIPEPQALQPLLEQAALSADDAPAAQALALRLAGTLRQRKRSAGRAGIVQGLLQEFALSSQEGVALMCLAEALLRIPDAATRDALIRDKISRGNWQAHVGQSTSLFVNAAAWGLLLTGRLVATHSQAGLGQALTRIIGKSGEPLIRKGVDMSMRMMGEQFVTGQTIDAALAHARRLQAQGFRYSYDMLGEAALTAQDAAGYALAYENAIHAIGQASAGRGIYEGPGISIKLSALHPRYGRAQRERVMDELYPRLLQLVVLARRYDIGINIDAEESERLELSLDLLERLCAAPELAGYDGIGLVIQAYQKRCAPVIDWLIDLARRSRHRLMIRLVKGAYWDSEIKRAQVEGLSDYPVYTRKAHTDVSYLACAKKLLAAPDAVFAQFATHNAHTLAAIYHMAGQNYYAGQYEFQCLHGMGEPLYEEVVGPVAECKLARPCRIYAPVGTHETLLAYLVRRLLENGANTSFVNRIADASVPLAELVQDPIAVVRQAAHGETVCGARHPRIALPLDLLEHGRANSQGLDLNSEHSLRELAAALQASLRQHWQAGPLLAQPGALAPLGGLQAVVNPSNRADEVGHVQAAGASDIDSALTAATRFAPQWAAAAPAARAACLERAADAMQAELAPLMGLLVREAGKTYANAVAEVREAVDFLRFYAAQTRREFDNASHVPLGPVACISPWNFPLAIFTGQIAAALAAGNTVLAKPAGQTPLIAAEAVRLLWAAGVPREALQLLPGAGPSVGGALVADPRIQGVLFTGSTQVARILQATLAQRLTAHGQPVPLLAETGGQNAMIVDSSALAQQVVQDVLSSAFDSAGQRCSALRVLCLQDEVAEHILTMLKGAMAELRIGNPGALAVDIGPVIDARAQADIQRHIDALRASGHAVSQPVTRGVEAMAQGSFIAPTLIEISHIGQLQHEVFGPVLHVLRYRRDELGALIDAIDRTGYGLTMGLHTRIDETIACVAAQSQVGNLYVNRNMVGAVVGVQPFGGQGLSGTGPKAGGPLYLLRLLARRPGMAALTAIGNLGQPEAATSAPPADPAAAPPAPDASPHSALAPAPAAAIDPALQALAQWAREQRDPALVAICERFAATQPSGQHRVLSGPTGESNRYTTWPRERVLCLVGAEAGDSAITGASDNAVPVAADTATNAAAQDPNRLCQLAAVLAVGSTAVWPAAAQELAQRLPAAVQARIVLAADPLAATVPVDAALYHGPAPGRVALAQKLAARDGAIVALTALPPGDATLPLERLVTERAISINTAAAGGNASLMTLA